MVFVLITNAWLKQTKNVYFILYPNKIKLLFVHPLNKTIQIFARILKSIYFFKVR